MVNFLAFVDLSWLLYTNEALGACMVLGIYILNSAVAEMSLSTTWKSFFNCNPKSLISFANLGLLEYVCIAAGWCES